MNIQLFRLDDTTYFPPPHLALKEPNGLLALGGDLPNVCCKRIRTVYSRGSVTVSRCCGGHPIHEVYFFIEDYKNIEKLQKVFEKKHPYRVTKDEAFEQVIKACSKIPRNDNGTWITDDMQVAYVRLYKLGVAHSIEVWEENELVGGLYGLGIGNVFCGESMFHTRTNASKLAFFHLVHHMLYFGCRIIDCQMQTNHLSSMVSFSVSRDEF